ncbi:hypothetical protein LguiB_018163 [Lonicera macranthoides]
MSSSSFFVSTTTISSSANILIGEGSSAGTLSQRSLEIALNLTKKDSKLVLILKLAGMKPDVHPLTLIRAKKSFCNFEVLTSMSIRPPHLLPIASNMLFFHKLIGRPSTVIQPPVHVILLF